MKQVALRWPFSEPLHANLRGEGDYGCETFL